MLTPKKKIFIGLVGAVVLAGAASAASAGLDVRDAYEYDNKRGFAQEITLAGPQYHTIAPQDDNDWLVFYPPGAGLYVLKFTDVTEPLKIEVWAARDDRDKEKRVEKFNVPRGASQRNIIIQPYIRYLKIRIRARDDDEEGAYQISINLVRTLVRREVIQREIIIEERPTVVVDINYGLYQRPFWPFGYFYYSTGRHYRNRAVIRTSIGRHRIRGRRHDLGFSRQHRNGTLRRSGGFRQGRNFTRSRRHAGLSGQRNRHAGQHAGLSSHRNRRAGRGAGLSGHRNRRAGRGARRGGGHGGRRSGH